MRRSCSATALDEQMGVAHLPQQRVLLGRDALEDDHLSLERCVLRGQRIDRRA
jgi:hypothetical protein